ncbi:uncharacterized protein [Rutidosis leptorrhynchoides]|uniref:uncharacterized protein n=1 Tax=Rutidosis leptorrhynchoides TaxID=125765 RepID=UPI003A99748E
MTPIVEFLNKGTLPIDSVEARKIKMKAPMYLLDKGILYKKSFLGPHLRCLNPTQAETIIREVHEGMCALHSGHKTVVSKIMRLGYYWPSMYRDAAEVIRKLGSFPAGPGGVKFLVVAIDYFTKWVEAKSLKTISGKQIQNFVWENIVCRFGIPNEIVSDNGKQFEGNPFSDWCQELNIKQTFTSVAHPQVNASFDESSNSKELCENLNLVEERREMAAIKEAINKQIITSYYNKRVQPLSFQLDDLVWRKNEASRAEDTGKLEPKWEGPYKVIGISDTWVYRLASLDGKAIKRTWHAQTLKRCYI